MSLIQRTGACIYCGQMGTVEAEEIIPDKEIDKMVSLKCECSLAKETVKKAGRQQRAEENAERLFADHPDEVTCFLKAAVVLVSEDQICQVSVDTGRKTKARISKTSKGSIKVERIETRKTAVEN